MRWGKHLDAMCAGRTQHRLTGESRASIAALPWRRYVRARLRGAGWRLIVLTTWSSSYGRGVMDGSGLFLAPVVRFTGNSGTRRVSGRGITSIGTRSRLVQRELVLLAWQTSWQQWDVVA